MYINSFNGDLIACLGASRNLNANYLEIYLKRHIKKIA